MKKFLTSEEAIELLPEGEEIHTFYNFPFGFVGADWEREDIIERLNNPNYKIEVCGEAARAMNHGICVYKKGETIQSNILFIETNMDKLNEIDPLPEKKEERTTVSEKFVSLNAYKQVRWERDIAIQQLHELGYELGQKIEPTTKNCESCRNYGSHNGVCDICEDYNCFTEPNNSTTKNDLGVDAVSRKAVLNTLDKELTGLEIGSWLAPRGGYFISFDSMEGCAKAIVAKCKEAGLIMTNAGATFPYGKDPKDTNIRIAPSFPTPEELEVATQIFVLSVKLVSIDKILENK